MLHLDWAGGGHWTTGPFSSILPSSLSHGAAGVQMEEEVAEEKYKTLEVSESCRWGWQQLWGATLESTALSSSLPD